MNARAPDADRAPRSVARDFAPLAELEELRDLVRALRGGEIDGLVVELSGRDEVLTLSGADRPYRLFVEGMTQGAATVSQDGIILSVNPRLAALLATSREELVGGRIASLLAPGDDASFDELLAPLPTAERRLTLRTRDERLLPVTVTSNLLDLDDETVVCLMVSDETERERAAQQLTASERWFRALVASSSDLIVVADAEARLTYVNPACERILGIAPEDMLGLSMLDLVHPDDLTEVADHFDGIVDGTTTGVRTEARFATADGGWCVLEVVSTNCLEDDAIVGVVINARDVTDSKRADEAEAILRERDQRFRQAQTYSGIGMALVGLDGRWLEVNPALCRILGRSATELHGLTFQDITHPGDLDADLAEVQRLLAGEIDGYEMTKRYLRADGTVIWAQLNGSVVRDDGGLPLYFVAQVQDITDERARHEELERQRQDLARSNADLEQFAYVASHDLSEPLRSISGFAALLEEDWGDELTGEAREYLGFMIDGTTRMQTLINDLLAFSRVTRSPMLVAPVDLGVTLSHVLSSLDATIADKDAVVHVGDLPEVQANGTLMTQLFQNLVANALKFHRRGAPPRVRVEWRAAADGSAEIIVEDDGIGIEEQYRERVFRMFQRLHTRTDYEGTGMGLAVCSKIVDSVGGRIWITDSPLGGVAFHLTLPLAQESSR